MSASIYSYENHIEQFRSIVRILKTKILICINYKPNHAIYSTVNSLFFVPHPHAWEPAIYFTGSHTHEIHTMHAIM